MSKQPEKTSLVTLAAVLGVACAQFGFAQTFHSVPVQNNAGFVGISAGGNSVWAADAAGNAYSYSYGGSGFTLYHQTAGKFTQQIAAGGGSSFTLQPDAVWALDLSDNIYQLTGAGFVKVPGSLSQIAVGPGGRDSCHAYEVWGINSASQVFRFDYCSGQFNQQPGALAQIAVGGAGVWGLNSSQEIYELDFATHAFIQIPGTLRQIAVGPSGTWGLGLNDQVYQFDPVTQSFVAMNGQFLNEISAGGNGVWGVSFNDAGPDSPIWRLEPSTQSFVQVPGSLAFITVGTGGGIWGITIPFQPGSTNVWAFSTP
jgi:hypothetical protein